MKSRLVSVALLAAALAFAVPSGALAQGRGHGGDRGSHGGGNRGGDHGNRGGGGGDHGNRGGDRGGWRAGGGDHGNRGGDRGGWRAGGGGDHGNRGGDRGGWRAGGGARVGGGDHRVVTRGGDHHGGWGTIGDLNRVRNDRRDVRVRGNVGSRNDVRYRGNVGFRNDVRYRGGRDRGGRTVYSPRFAGRHYYSGYSVPRYFGGYRFRGGYRYGGYSYPRFFYYNSYYPRPHFIHSGFSIGFVLGSYPGAGYRYYDPYCDRYFSSLSYYDDHCWDYGHPPVVEVLRYGSPVASAVFDNGEWVVDDCD